MLLSRFRLHIILFCVPRTASGKRKITLLFSHELEVPPPVLFFATCEVKSINFIYLRAELECQENSLNGLAN